MRPARAVRDRQSRSPPERPEPEPHRWSSIAFLLSGWPAELRGHGSAAGQALGWAGRRDGPTRATAGEGDICPVAGNVARSTKTAILSLPVSSHRAARTG